MPSVIGKRIRYPWYGGGDRPMIFADGEIVDRKGDWVAVVDPDGRKIWRRISDENVRVL